MHSLKSFFRLVFELEFKPSLWRIIATPKFKEMMKVLDTMTDLSCEYVDEAKAKLEEKSKNDTNSHEESILEKLLKIDPIIAKVMAMDMLFAGVDTVCYPLNEFGTNYRENSRPSRLILQHFQHLFF